MSFTNDVKVWKQHAEELAELWIEITARRDLYAYYNHKDMVVGGQKPEGPDGLQKRLLKHFRCEYVMGTYALAEDEHQDAYGRWICIDIDAKGDGYEGRAIRNLELALGYADAFKRHGIDSLVEQSGPKGSYHVWAFFDRDVPAGQLYLAGQLIRQHGIRGKNELPEAFPKSNLLSGSKRTGTMVRVPGRYKSQEWTSRFYDSDGNILPTAAGIALLLERLQDLNPVELLNEETDIYQVAAKRFQVMQKPIGGDFTPEDEPGWLAEIVMEERGRQAWETIVTLIDERKREQPREGNRHESMWWAGNLVAIRFGMYDSQAAHEVLERFDREYCGGYNGPAQVADALRNAVSRRTMEIGWGLRPECMDPKLGEDIGLKVAGSNTLERARKIAKREIYSVVRYPEGREGIVLFNIPPGVGKTESYVDAVADSTDERYLIAVPTHKQSLELVDRLDQAHGLPMAVGRYPEQVVEGHEEGASQPANCWNEEAWVGRSYGNGRMFCHECEFGDTCKDRGYLAQLEAAEDQRVRICTQKTLANNGFIPMTPRKTTVILDENPIAVIAPKEEISTAELAGAARAAEEAMESSSFGDPCYELLKAVNQVCRTMMNATDGQHMASGLPTGEPVADDGLMRMRIRNWSLHRLVRHHRERHPERSVNMNFLLSLATDRLGGRAMYYTKHGEAVTVEINNYPESQKALTICLDATTTKDQLERIMQRRKCRIREVTCGGKLELQAKAIQILRDGARKKPEKIASAIVEAITNRNRLELSDKPIERIGLISTRQAIEATREMCPEPLWRKIAKVDWFGGKQVRGSNEWIEHDLLIVAGTPRFPIEAVRTSMSRWAPDVGTSEDEPDFIRWRWTPVNTGPACETAFFYGPKLENSLTATYFELIEAELEQAIQRARLYVPGLAIPAILICSYKTDLPAYKDFQFVGDQKTHRPLTDEDMLLYEAIRAEGGAASRSDLIPHLGHIEEKRLKGYLKRHIAKLVDAGLVTKSGNTKNTMYTVTGG